MTPLHARYCACRAISERSTMGCLQIEEEARHGHRGSKTSPAGVHQRAVCGFFQAGKPEKDGRRFKKGGLRIRPRISHVDRRAESHHDGKTKVHESFAALASDR